MRTIEGHLLDCYESGMDINLEDVVNTKFENDICNAINMCSSGRLREIKDMLSEEVSYFDIKYYIIKINTK